MGPELLQDHGGPEREHAAVPEEIPGRQVAAGGVEVGLLHEPADGGRGGAFPRLHVPVAGFGVMGGDAEGHDAPLHGQLHGGSEFLVKGREIDDDMIGGEDPQHGVLDIRADLKARQQNRRCGVAARRLADDPAAGRNADGLHVPGDLMPVLFTADHAHVLRGEGRHQAMQGALDQGFAADQLGQLLGVELPRHGPQPRSAAARQQNGVNRQFSCCHGESFLAFFARS